MTVKEIENTLLNLRYAIEEKRHLVLDDNEIRLRIGRELLAWFNGYNSCLIMNYADSTQHKTIYGYPIEIEYEKTMCLEVHIVYSVPIYRESEG